MPVGTERGSRSQHVLAMVIVSAQPFRGYPVRHSQDFSTAMPEPPVTLLWRVTGSSRATDISFDVRAHGVGGRDPIVWKGVRDGCVTDYSKLGAIYITNVQNAAPGWFWVEVELD